MSGIISPSGGEFLVNNMNFSENLYDWKQNVGFVPQNVFILNDTVRKNNLGKMRVRLMTKN